jgi:hypothetical protein
LIRIDYKSGGITAEGAAEGGLVFVNRLPGVHGGGFLLVGFVGWVIIAARITADLGIKPHLPEIPVLLLVWGVAAALAWMVFRIKHYREELWLKRGQMYCARRISRGPLRPLMSAETVKTVDIVRVSKGRGDVEVIEILGSEGIIHFGEKMDSMSMSKIVQQIRDWIENERGWVLQPVFDQRALEEELQKKSGCGRNNRQEWDGLDLARQSALNWMWATRTMRLYGSQPKRALLIHPQIRFEFELPESVRNGMSIFALVLFVSVSLFLIATTIRSVGFAIAHRSWAWLLMFSPLILVSMAMGWVMWVLADEFLPQVREWMLER